MPGTTRVLVVEDAKALRKSLVQTLQAHPEFDVAGAAEGGQAALEMCEVLRPDVVAMDVSLPDLSAAETTDQIMSRCATPILILASSKKKSDLLHSFDALAAGGIDALEKFVGKKPEGAWKERFYGALRVISHVRVTQRPTKLKVWESSRDRLGPRLVPPEGVFPPRLVAFGAGTGGPGALAQILEPLPQDYPLPAVAALQVKEPFAAVLANWLDSRVKLPVRLAEEGEPLPEVGQAGVLLAPAGRNLVIRRGKVRLLKGRDKKSIKPSVDILFDSLSQEYGPRVVACLLTGMGQDGAEGLLQVRRSGGMTLAQDEATSVIFEMPGEAVRVGAAERVLSLSEFSPSLIASARKALTDEIPEF